MKRSFTILLFLFFTVSLCAGSSAIDLTGENSAEKILEISSDPKSYLGKTIRMPGYYTYEDFSDTRYHYVLLNKTGEENLGFEIRWEGEYPGPGTAVTVTGKLMTETVYGQAYIFLEISDLNILTPAP